MKYNIRSLIHVALQIGLFFVLFFSTDFYWHLLSMLFMAAGVALAFWAIYQFRGGGLTAFPEPKPDRDLICSGPYKQIRHPMYSSLFLVITSLLIMEFNGFRMAIALAFLVNQVLKLLYEEKMLLERMPGYQNYMQNSWRLLPFVF